MPDEKRRTFVLIIMIGFRNCKHISADTLIPGWMISSGQIFHQKRYLQIVQYSYFKVSN
jgi:hypothetical protein